MKTALLLLALLLAAPAAAQPPYVDCTAAGATVELVPGARLLHNGTGVPLPSGENVLFPRLHKDGARFAGVGHTSDRAWEWDGAWHDRGPAAGVNALIYDSLGQLHIVRDTRTAPTGSQGWRYVADDGSLVSGDATYADPARGIWEFTTRGDITVGQGGDEDGLQALVRGRRVRLAEGVIRFIRFDRLGDELTICYVRLDTGEARFLALTVADLDALPTYVPPGVVAPTPPIPAPIPPVVAPIPSTQDPDPNRAEAIVRAERERFGPMDRAQVAQFLRASAAALNAAQIGGGPFGVLIKTSGNQCEGISCDILCSGQDAAQRQWDVLVDHGGPNEHVVWSEVEGITVRPCEIVAAGSKPPPVVVPPPVCPVCPPDQRDEVERLHEQTHALDELLAVAREAAQVAIDDRKELQRQLDALLSAPPPRCTASIFGIKIKCRVIQ